MSFLALGPAHDRGEPGEVGVHSISATLMGVSPPALYAFTVEEWHRMADAGIFYEDTRVELLGGQVVKMVPVGSHHVASVNRLNRMMGSAFADRAIVSVQNPLRLDDHSEPHTDIALLHPRADFYAEAAANADDAFLVVEVADTSLVWDRDTKGPRYAAAGIPAFWIVDLPGTEILVFSDPPRRDTRISTTPDQATGSLSPGSPE